MNRVEAVHLAKELADFEGVTHWAISQRIFGRGDFFQKLMDGRDCYQATLEKAETWFGRNWPDDLAWPSDIERPSRQVELDRAS